MEHELFQSKLKPSVEGALVPEIIRDSSSGLDSHRTAAMELFFESSIQGRRERMFAKVKTSLCPDLTPWSKETSEGSTVSIPEVKPSAPAPVLQPPQFLPSDATLDVSTRAVSAPINHETSQNPPKHARKTEAAQSKAPVVTMGKTVFFQ